MQADVASFPDDQNVVWATPSQDSSGSMPLGNGDIGLNVWVEPNGDLVFYIAKTDAWSEVARLLKLGRVRVSLSPNPFAEPVSFRQVLKLREGEIVVTGGEGAAQSTLRVWVDANHPVIRVEANTPQPSTLRASLEVWRTEEREIKGSEQHSAYGSVKAPFPVLESGDTVLPQQANQVVWYHRNATSTFRNTLELQGLAEWGKNQIDPLLHRTFGALMQGEGLTNAGDSALQSSQPRTTHTLAITPLTAQTPTVAEWQQQLEAQAARLAALDLPKTQLAHRAWWSEFWNRSSIKIEQALNSNPGAATPPAGAAISSSEVPLRFGTDANTQNRFIGDIGRVRLYNRALSETQIAELAAKPEAPSPAELAPVGDWSFENLKDGSFANSTGEGLAAKVVGRVEVVEGRGGKAVRMNRTGYLEVAPDPRLDFSTAVTLEMWAAPARQARQGARLIDKAPVGTAEGYLLDTYPGNSLRMIIKPGAVAAKEALTPDEWSHIVATYDAGRGEQRLYVNGKIVESKQYGAAPAPPAATTAPAETPAQIVARAYALQRFINACAGRGEFPIKFNGSLFTVESRVAKYPYNADFRLWGGMYWAQNTRLAYWPMLKSGDFEMMRPLFEMYYQALPLARERTEQFFAHGGAFFPETMEFWGTYGNQNYGWNRKGKPLSHVDNTYIRYHYAGALEIAAMMLEYFAYTGDNKFLQTVALPFTDEVVRFYFEHYKRDADGTLLLNPAQALETYYDVTNPTPDIAGLRALLSTLLELPTTDAPEEARGRWQQWQSALPALPLGGAEGAAVILPAQKTTRPPQNVENPELYAVFPFRHYGVGRKVLEIGRRTFAARRIKGSRGWYQDDIQAAYLGLAGEARRLLVSRFSAKDPDSRCPAFWGPNFDWVPDQDHGNAGVLALQAMLMQADDKKIMLFPAWPGDWNVDFKLHAPHNTIVQGSYRNGKIGEIKVTPAARKADLVVLQPQGS